MIKESGMVEMIPSYCGEEVKSNAEKKVFEILRGLTLKNGYVLHSLGLPKHNNKIYGEIDFVVICDRGVACLEVKGGGVECREGVWIFRDRYGVERQKTEGPFAQVKGNMFSLKEILKKKFPNNRHIKDLLLACGVLFPDIEFKSNSQEIISEIIFDLNTKDITEYMHRVFDYWEGRQHRKPAKLAPGDIREIADYLRGEFDFIPNLANRLSHAEDEIIRLTNEQSKLMESLADNERLLIEGFAGTGKTLMASYFAKKMALEGKKVLYLSYNTNLAFAVGKRLADVESLKVINLHALFGEYVEIDKKLVREQAQNYFSKQLPEAAYQYLSALGEEERKSLSYDVIIMDEGQDILRAEYLYPLDIILDKGLEKGSWAVFYDEKQNIYNPDYEEGMELIRSYPCAKFKLHINCRNTARIGRFGSKGYRSLPDYYMREEGEDVQKISYANEDEFQRRVQEIFRNMKKEGIQNEDIVFLSPRTYEKSKLSDTEIKVCVYKEDQENSGKLPLYSTIQSFKGLDSKVAVLIDTEYIMEEMFERFLYIASTRARTMLFVLGDEAFWRKEENR